MASRFAELAIDCADPRSLAQFWSEALGYVVVESDAELVSIGPPGGAGPMLTFARVPEPKRVKNRLHVDLTPTDRAQEAEVRRLESLGARRVDVGQGAASWVVLADPEGNEFCVLAG